MKILMTGNPEKDLCKEICSLLSKENLAEYKCLSRANGFDFEDSGAGTIKRIIKEANDFDVFINLFANFHYNASLLTQKLYADWAAKKYDENRIINVGSTTDRVQRGKMNLYHYEKRALRDLSQGLAIIGVWEKAPKLTHISYGTLENRQDKNPGRRCLTLKEAAEYIVWVLKQPKHININEISIDPIQHPPLS